MNDLVLASGRGEIAVGVRQWTTADSVRLAMVIGGMIVAVVVLGIIIMYMRRRMFAADSEMEGARSLMDELRAMRKSGEMSEAEYEAARRSLATKVASRVKRQAAEQPPETYAPRLPRSAMPSPGSPPASSASPSGPRARTARPGFDLTGEPLPPRAKDAPGSGKEGGE